MLLNGLAIILLGLVPGSLIALCVQLVRTSLGF